MILKVMFFVLLAGCSVPAPDWSFTSDPITKVSGTYDGSGSVPTMDCRGWVFADTFGANNPDTTIALEKHIVITANIGGIEVTLLEYWLPLVTVQLEEGDEGGHELYANDVKFDRTKTVKGLEKPMAELRFAAYQNESQISTWGAVELIIDP